MSDLLFFSVRVLGDRSSSVAMLDRQAEEVARMFAAFAPYTAVIPDFNGINRVVRAGVIKD